MNKNKIYFFILSTIVILYFSIFSFYKIDLVTADLGRHIKNGEIFLKSDLYQIPKSSLLHTNLFSYTYPTFNFVNHHWLSGVIAYLIFSFFGFSGLSLIYFLLLSSSIIFVLFLIKEKSGYFEILFSSLLFIPLIADRIEVRPEGLSYLFISIFLFVLYKYSKNEIPKKILWILPAIMVVWVNSHIYFIFGIFIIGVFLFETILLKQSEKIKNLTKILLASLVVTSINPYGIGGILYPFKIFQNYGYKIVENQSITFLENISFNNPSFLLYKINIILLIISTLIILIKKREKFLISLTIISLTFAILAYLGVRNISIFGLTSLPLFAYNLSVIKSLIRKEKDLDGEFKIIVYTILILVSVLGIFYHFSNRLIWNRESGLGINQKDLASTNFILKNNISGPVFNNYDIGGFMIFSLFPREKVFVDNRPEVYPKEFFEKIYIPMQENEIVWNRILKEENFNTIYFYRLDYTPWAQKFLISRITDENWAPVFVDDKTIIFLRRNDKNNSLIQTYELPKEIFGY